MVMLERSLAVAMNARITGSGKETLILSHGYGADHTIWDQILPSLAQRYRVLVFDWNFSGAATDRNPFDPVKHSSFEAYAADLIDLVDEMNLKSSVFVGHSMSGMVGCIASVKRPDLFKKLVLINASPRYMNCEDYEGGFESHELQQIFSSIESNFQTWVSGFAPLAVGPNYPLSVQKFQKSLSSMKPEAALPLAKTVFGSDKRDVLENVQIPCTIVQTTEDIVVPFSVAHYMHKKIRAKSTVEIIDSYGHFPQLTAPKLLLSILENVMGSFDAKNQSC